MNVFLVVASIVGIIALLVVMARQGRLKFERQVKKVNDRDNLQFPFEPHLGTPLSCLLFDRVNKKVLFISDSTEEVLGYDYFTRWVTEWDERRNGDAYRFRIALTTTDFDRPRLVFGTGTLAASRQWMARLDVLFNRE